jgi:molybdate transport system ATP-binding protein
MLDVNCRLRRGAFQLDAVFTAPARGVTALFGRSGSGKSTLVSALAGLVTPSSGWIRWDDNILYDATERVNVLPEQRALGCVFQDARLFPHLSVPGNLRYGLSRARGRALRISLESVIELLSLDSLMSRRVFQLSGGERQRVALGRALLSQPRGLLLDEPLASLDAARKDEVLPWLERLRHELGIPIVYVSHSFDEVVRLADHVVVIGDGKVLASASLPHVCGERVVGSVIEGRVIHHDANEGLATVHAGALELRVARPGAGDRIRLHVAADDVTIARERPRAISTRNVIEMRVVRVEPSADSLLVHLSRGESRLLARITHSAARELDVQPGIECFALLKAVAAYGRRPDRAAE